VSLLGEIRDRALATAPAPPGWAVVAAAVTALALVAAPRVWPVTRRVVTIAHEGAHAAVALLTGRRLSGIRLHADGSGLTVSSGRSRGPGAVLMLAAGYPGPALLGLGAAALVAAGRPALTLWAAVVLLALVLVLVRNWYGLWSVLVTGGVVLAVTWWAPADWQTTAGQLAAWVLLLGAPRTVLELQGQRRRRGGAASDADQLARLTPLPALGWVALFLVTTVGALVLGAAMLLPASGRMLPW
jgi:hypothetical protein